MNNILKTVILSVVTSTLLYSSDIAINSVGVHLGKGYTTHSLEDKEGSIDGINRPAKNYLGIELFTTFNGIDEENEIRPYLSYSYLKNDEIKHSFILAGLNKYFLEDDIEYYGGFVGGYGKYDWQYNPINDTVIINTMQIAL